MLQLVKSGKLQTQSEVSVIWSD